MSSRVQSLAALTVVGLLSAGCSGTSADRGSSGGINANTATQSQAVKFAECMRNNGVKDFPDPDASGQLTIDAVANSSVDTNSPAFQHALSACKDLQPPGFTGNKRSAQQQAA